MSTVNYESLYSWSLDCNLLESVQRFSSLVGMKGWDSEYSEKPSRYLSSLETRTNLPYKI